MQFKTVHGTQETKPLMVECCGDKVYLRKNIHEITVSSGMGEEENLINMWEYDEAYISLEEFNEYFAEKTTDAEYTLQAQIDYIAVMSDIDLEEE